MSGPPTVAPPATHTARAVDARYSRLKYLGGGAYGSVCSADDAMTGRKVSARVVTYVARCRHASLAGAKVRAPAWVLRYERMRAPPSLQLSYAIAPCRRLVGSPAGGPTIGVNRPFPRPSRHLAKLPWYIQP
jgi:hypothetical protein